MLVVLLGQRLFLVHYGLVAQLAGTVVLGLVTYALYFFLFDRRVFSEVRAMLKR